MSYLYARLARPSPHGSMTTDKSEGVVLSTVRYGDDAVIVSALTRDAGRRAYMAALGASRRRAGLLAPLSVVEFVAAGRR